jgi:hypothetical protein
MNGLDLNSDDVLARVTFSIVREDDLLRQLSRRIVRS